MGIAKVKNRLKFSNAYILWREKRKNLGKPYNRSGKAKDKSVSPYWFSSKEIGEYATSQADVVEVAKRLERHHHRQAKQTLNSMLADNIDRERHRWTSDKRKRYSGRRITDNSTPEYCQGKLTGQGDSYCIDCSHHLTCSTVAEADQLCPDSPETNERNYWWFGTELFYFGDEEYKD